VKCSKLIDNSQCTCSQTAEAHSLYESYNVDNAFNLNTPCSSSDKRQDVSERKSPLSTTAVTK